MGTAHLDHETDDDDHSHARHDVGVVDDDELVAEYGQVLVGGGGLSAFDRCHFSGRTDDTKNCGREEDVCVYVCVCDVVLLLLLLLLVLPLLLSLLPRTQHVRAVSEQPEWRTKSTRRTSGAHGRAFYTETGRAPHTGSYIVVVATAVPEYQPGGLMRRRRQCSVTFTGC